MIRKIFLFMIILSSTLCNKNVIDIESNKKHNILTPNHIVDHDRDPKTFGLLLDLLKGAHIRAILSFDVFEEFEAHEIEEELHHHHHPHHFSHHPHHHHRHHHHSHHPHHHHPEWFDYHDIPYFKRSIKSASNDRKTVKGQSNGTRTVNIMSDQKITKNSANELKTVVRRKVRDVVKNSAFMRPLKIKEPSTDIKKTDSTDQKINAGPTTISTSTAENASSNKISGLLMMLNLINLTTPSPPVGIMTTFTTPPVPSVSTEKFEKPEPPTTPTQLPTKQVPTTISYNPWQICYPPHCPSVDVSSTIQPISSEYQNDYHQPFFSEIGTNYFDQSYPNSFAQHHPQTSSIHLTVLIRSSVVPPPSSLSSFKDKFNVLHTQQFHQDRSDFDSILHRYPYFHRQSKPLKHYFRASVPDHFRNELYSDDRKNQNFHPLMHEAQSNNIW